MAQRLQDGGSGSGDPRRRRRHRARYRACQGHERNRKPARRRLIRHAPASATLRPRRKIPSLGERPARRSAAQAFNFQEEPFKERLQGEASRRALAMASEHTVGFEPADELAKDRESVRRRFWIKLKRVIAKIPFAEDLLAAYYCAFDKQTPRHVQAALLGAIAYFILPFDFIPDMLPVLGFTDDAAVLATAIRLVASHITPEHREAARAALKRGIDREG